jgi:ABC-type dipeptide/oligopeptide/nickel transport system permease component
VKLIIVGVVIFGILAGIVYGFKLNSKIDGIKSVLMIMLSLMDMITLAALMAYGLWNLPLYLWKCKDNKETLYNLLAQATDIRYQYRESMADFYLIIS